MNEKRGRVLRSTDDDGPAAPEAASHRKPRQFRKVVEAAPAISIGGEGEAAAAKYAEQVAGLIERDIIRSGSGIGQTLGNEAELANRYGVSRWIVREALAVVEQDGLARMRVGRNGGLMVTAVPEHALAAAICNYLLFTRTTGADVIDVRLAIERVICHAAAKGIDDSKFEVALEVLRNPPQTQSVDALGVTYFDKTLELVQNPVITLCARSLSMLSRCMFTLYPAPDPPPSVACKLLEWRRRQLECAIAGDADGAIMAGNQAGDVWTNMFLVTESGGKWRPPKIDGPNFAVVLAETVASILHPGHKIKLSAIAATRLMLDILSKDLQPGEPLAKEAELTKVLGVGRNVFREAVRILERGGFVRTEVGRNGGLRVGQPSQEKLVSRIMQFLTIRRLPPEHFIALSKALILLAAELTANEVKAGRDRELLSIIEILTEIDNADYLSAPTILKKFQLQLGDTCANPALKLFLSIAGGSEDLMPIWRLRQSADLHLVIERLKSVLRKGDSILTRRALSQMFAHETRHTYQ